MIQKIIKFFSILVIIVGCVFLANGLILAWSTPDLPPPDGNVSPPINTGSSNQTKNAGLTLDGSTYGLWADGTSYGVYGKDSDGGAYGYLGVSNYYGGQFFGKYGAYVKDTDHGTYAYLAHQGYGIYSNGIIRGSYFMDHNSTSYVVNPAGTSKFNTINLGGVERSSWPDSTDTNNYTNGVSFNTGNGILTLTRQGLGSLTVDLDNRYLTSFSELDPQVNSLSSGKWCTSDGSKINCTTDAPSVSESDTLQSVTNRGASTNKSISVAGLTTGSISMNSNTTISNSNRMHITATEDIYLLPKGGEVYVSSAWGGAGNLAASGNISANNGAATLYWQGNEGEVLRLRGNNNQNMHFQNINGTFRLVNHPWTAEIFSVDQSGNVNIRNTMSLNSNRITNVANPVDAQDAATKAYVDGASGYIRGGHYGICARGTSSYAGAIWPAFMRAATGWQCECDSGFTPGLIALPSDGGRIMTCIKD